MKVINVCGNPIIMYSDNKKDCYYDIIVSGVTFRRSLTIEMLKSSIKQMCCDWMRKGYGMRVVQDAACLSEIHLIPIKRDDKCLRCKKMLNSIYGSMV